MQKRIRQQVTLSDSFTSSLLSYPNTPLTAVQICHHRTYNRVMVCVCACMVLHLHYHIVFFVGEELAPPEILWCLP